MKIVLVFLLGMACMLPAALIPQNGFSGRPGDGTCRDCHPAKTLVPPDSSAVLGLPDEFEPETVYPCTLVIRYPGLDEWSFLMTTVDSLSNQAGRIRVTDSTHTLLDSLDSILYFKNSLKGLHFGQRDSVRWVFEYETPTAGAGPVTFYWCTYMKNRKVGNRYYLMENCRTVCSAGPE